jgi:hypothetical protein
MPFFKLLIAFAPWLSFLILSHFGLLGLKAGLLLGLGLSIAMGIAGLHRGVILWVGLAFFTYAAIAVIGFGSFWAERHMGILANAALAAGAWAGLLTGRPFTADYARAHTSPEIWHTPSFIRTNMMITALWAAVFSLNAILAWARAGEAWGYIGLIGAAWFSSWYPARVRRARLG